MKALLEKVTTAPATPAQIRRWFVVFAVLFAIAAGLRVAASIAIVLGQ